MSAAARVSSIVLCVVFAWAGAAKLADREGTVDAFGSLGLRRPADLAIVVPVLELFVAVELIAMPLVGAYGALFMLVAFTVVLVGVVRRGVPVACACFGSVSTRRADPVTWRSLLRNAVLIVLALLAAAGAPTAVIGR
jgi:uncharacterized membrane protein YphA (DoxX/SURF4 family)